MKVEHYAFGTITINGKTYQNDVIVFPDAVQANWYRKDGHSLCMDDLDTVLAFHPDIFVMGAGASGVLHIPETIRQQLAEHHIQLIDKITPEACEIFNRYSKKGEKVVAGFHLTC